MRSYINSEFYRILRYLWTYLFVGICSLLLVSTNIILAAVKHSDSTFTYATTGFTLSNFYTSLSAVFFLSISVASMIYGNEYAHHTMKNSIAYGIPRSYIYFGKLIVEVIYAIAAFILITGIFISSAYLLLENSGTENLMLLLQSCFVSLPLLLFVISATNCFIFILESTGAAISAITGYVFVIPLVSNYLGMKFIFFRKLAKILPWNMLRKIHFDFDSNQLILPWPGNSGYYYYWLFGLTHMLLISLIGYFIYRKKEIK